MQAQNELAVLIDRLSSEDEGERLYAVEDITEAGMPESVHFLAARLNGETSQVVRDALSFALKRLDCSNAYPLIFDLFRSEDAYLRNAAVSIFGAGGEDGAAYFDSRLDEADREVRKLILDALMETGLAGAVFAIRAELHDEAPNVRITAVEYLGRMQDAESVDELIALFRTDPEPMLRASVMEALSSIGNVSAIKEAVSFLMAEGGIDDAANIYLPQLMKLVAVGGSKDDVVRVVCSIADVAIYGEDIITMLSDANRRLGATILAPKVRKVLQKIAVAPRLRDDLRYGALTLLAHSGAASARKTIEGMMNKTDDEDLRSFCRECLDAEPGSRGKP